MKATRMLSSVLAMLVLLAMAVTAKAQVNYTWVTTGSGASGSWTNGVNWGQVETTYPVSGDGANLNGAIASGAYTCIFDYAPGLGGPLATLALSSGGGAGQAWLVVTNATLSVDVFSLGSGGVLQIDSGGVVTNSAALTADWWTGTTGAIYPNAGGSFVTPNGATLGYNLSNRKAAVSSTDSLGGVWNFIGGLRVGYCAGNGSSSGNELAIDGGVVVTNGGALVVGSKNPGGNLGTGSCNNNKVTIQGGARLYTTGDSQIGYSSKSGGAGGNVGTISAANSLWNLGGGSLKVGQGVTGNSLVVMNGGVVTNAGTITVYSGNSVSLGLGGKIFATTMTNPSKLTIPISTGTPNCGYFDVSGNLNISGCTLDITGTVSKDTVPAVFAEYGTLTTNVVPIVTGLTGDLFIDYAYGVGGNQIAVVAPPPKGMLLIIK